MKMDISQVAFHHLVFLARVDDQVVGAEIVLIEKYRTTLGISRELAHGLLSKEAPRPPSPDSIEASVVEKSHILRMMVRVALEDGRISRREHKLLKQVASAFKISSVEFADIVVTIQSNVGTRKGLQRFRGRTIVVLVVAGLLAWFGYTNLGNKSEQQRVDGEQSLHLLKAQLESQAALEKKELLIARNQDREREQTLTGRLAELERSLRDDTTPSNVTVTRSELQDLKDQLGLLRERNSLFKDVERKYNASVVLVCMSYEMVLGPERRKKWSTGTGFFVSPEGHIVTNKHVVQPWKFGVPEAKLRDQGFTLDKQTIFIGVWPAGSQITKDDGKLNLESGYSTFHGTLALDKIAPDSYVQTRRNDPHGSGSYPSRYHEFDAGDLAVLKAEAMNPPLALSINPDTESIEKLDPVLLLGFPGTFDNLETTIAETAPALGEIRKVEKRIFATAPLVPGNSGGPLFDLDGHVIGIAATYHGHPSVAGCIPAKYILPLLPGRDQLIKIAIDFEKDGHLGAALDQLQLAKQVGEEVGLIKTIQSRIIKKRDLLLSQAKTALIDAPIDESRNLLTEILDTFGPRWGVEAWILLRERS